MKKLFLIGNGFDLAHGIPTSYEDFHDFLKEEYSVEDDDDDDLLIPESYRLPDGGERYDDEELVKFLIGIISKAESTEKWSDVERSLGELDYSEYLDNWLEDDDDNKDEEVDENESNANALSYAIMRIQYFFNIWIESIDISDISKKTDFDKLIDIENDLFLTFNYTETLENLYNVKNVCHIHGEQDTEIYFGHGDETDYTEKYERDHIGSEYILRNLDEELRKKTENALVDNQWFFNTIDNKVSEIYSFGFSFSDVDLVYIKEIFKKLNTSNVTWYLNDFSDETELNRHKDIIIKCGFKGKFDTYHIN